MNTAAPVRRKIPLPVLIAIAGGLVAVAGGLFVLSRPPANRVENNSPASQEARAYVRNLLLKDVTIQATENFMNQQVVEVQGSIGNQGPRALQLVDVYCLFQNVNGQEIRRERLPIVAAKGQPLKPGEIRKFRLPFDSVPEGWNQAIPRMVIAQIAFAR